MATPHLDSAQFQTPVKKRCSSPALSSPSSISTTSTNPKQRSITGSSSTNNNDDTITTIKMEDGTDEVKVFSASTIKKNEPDDDIDVDGIEDRLSPVVEEPTSPNKNDALNGGISSLYTSPFLYPYFHPMFQQYLMAAAAQANVAATSTDKPPIDGHMSSVPPVPNPYGGAPSPLSPFPGFNPGMPFPPLYPPGMVNQSFRPNLFNPFGIPIPTPGVRPPPAASASSSSSTSSNRHHHQNFEGSSRNLSALLDVQRPKKPHIKKPLNAFMLYMKEQRARVIEECTLKESSAINKVLGQKWKELPRAEQDRYYELAKEERNRHMQLYPGWSARDNYGLKKKRQSGGHTPILNNSHKKPPRENNSMVNSPGNLSHNSPHRFGQNHLSHNSPHGKNPMQMENAIDCLNQKKCRARFGLEGQSQWCKHCRRKKKCTRFLEDDMSNHQTNNNNMMMMNNYHPSMNNHGRTNSSHGNPSSVGSPRTNQSDNDDDDDDEGDDDDDSMDEPDADDILARQIDSIEDDDDEEDDDEHQMNNDDSDEENKQQHHQQSVSHVYKPVPTKTEPNLHQQYQQPPPAHLYQPSNLPSHFAANFHY